MKYLVLNSQKNKNIIIGNMKSSITTCRFFNNNDYNKYSNLKGEYTLFVFDGKYALKKESSKISNKIHTTTRNPITNKNEPFYVVEFKSEEYESISPIEFYNYTRKIIVDDLLDEI